MGAVELDKLTWPEVEAELKGGRDTVVTKLWKTRRFQWSNGLVKRSDGSNCARSKSEPGDAPRFFERIA